MSSSATSYELSYVVLIIQLTIGIVRSKTPDNNKKLTTVFVNATANLCWQRKNKKIKK